MHDFDTGDDAIVDLVSDRVGRHLRDLDRQSVQCAVAKEPNELRRDARVESFLPILAERRARQRLRGTQPVCPAPPAVGRDHDDGSDVA